MRLSLALMVCLLPSLGAAQTTGWDYDVRGSAGQGSLVFGAGETPHATLTIEGVVVAQGALRRDVAGWSLPHAPQQVEGLIDLLPMPPSSSGPGPQWRWLLAGDPGARVFEIRFTQDGRVVGRFHAHLQLLPVRVRPATRRGPRDGPLGVGPPKRQPVDTSKLLRNRWWSRGFVAGWGITASVWDALRGRDGTHLRGDVTDAQVARLHARLLTLPRPWSMKSIYQTARRQAGSQGEALRLAFAYSLEHQEAPVRPLRGIPAGEPLQDKTIHFFASAILARRSNSVGSVSVGLLKEIKDELPGGSGYNEHDVRADVLGAMFGEALLLNRVLDP
jgi:hypothetical protein